MATDIQSRIAKFAETQRTAQIDAAFAAFGTPKDIVDIIYSYVPRAASPSDIARILALDVPDKRLYVVGTISTDALSHTGSRCSPMPFPTPTDKAICGTTAYIYAKLDLCSVTATDDGLYRVNASLILSNRTIVRYYVGFSLTGALNFLIMTAVNHIYMHETIRLEHSWCFERHSAPPTLRAFAVDERA